MNLFESETVVFTDDGFIKIKDLLQKSSKVASFLKKQIPLNTDCILIDLQDPLSIITAVFAIWQAGYIAALINPLMMTHIKKNLIENLGSCYILSTLIEDQSPLTMQLDYDKISLLLATSGSCFEPKWIASSLNNWLYSAKGTNAFLKATCYQPWILNLPLFHVSGLAILFRALLSHAPLIISKQMLVENGRYSFVAKQINTLHHNNQLLWFLKASSLLIGGGKLDKHTFDKLTHLPFYLTYGMTEACSSITMSEKSPATIGEGTVLADRTIFINDKNEIFISGKTVCDFQWIKGTLYPLKNTQGYYATGDMGQFIDNQLVVLGRGDERIELNGEKIYPQKIENALWEHFDFKKLIISHIRRGNEDPLICAFCTQIPSDEEQKRLKKIIGSLFFPKYFFQLPDHPDNQKIILKDLKDYALKFLVNHPS